MDLFEVMIGIIVAITALTISLIYWLIKPYPEPIVTKGKIIDKYEVKGRTSASSLTNLGDFTVYYIPDSFNIMVLMENGDKTAFQISREKYDTLEIDDSVKVTEYSQIKKLVEKNIT